MPKYIVMGGSLGGTRAVGRILSQLPELPIPIVVVLHRHPLNNGALNQFLQEYTQLQIVEAMDKMPLEAGKVYLAPANYHLLIEQNHCALSVDDPVLFARPSIDVLFESVSNPAAIGVLLTGASHDGVAGLLAIKAAGGITIVQSPQFAECPVMPQAAIDARAAQYIVALKDIAPMLQKLLLLE